MLQSKIRHQLSGIVGNILEHYDAALFALIAPFISPLFFGNQDPLISLIMTYAIIPLGILTKPLGSIVFGFIGDRIGRKEALALSLFGMAATTFTMGCLPTYHSIGLLAPLSLALCRMLQSFFSAGEAVGAALLVLEHTSIQKRSLMSSLLDASSVIGMLLASCFMTLLCMHTHIENTWRLLFWIGGIPAIWGAFIQLKTPKETPFPEIQIQEATPLFSILKEHKKALFSITLVSGYSYMTYHLAFTLMNGYIPLVSTLNQTRLLQINNWLLGFDIVCLPLFGLLACRIGKSRLMILSSGLLAIGAIPLFAALNHSTLFTIIATRLFLVLCGVAYGASYFAWAVEKIEKKNRYTLLAVGGSLGSQLIGAPTSAICLWCYKTLKVPYAPAFYIILISLFSLYGVLHLKMTKEKTLKFNDMDR